MAEIFKQSPPSERTGPRRAFDKIGEYTAPVSATIGAVGTLGAVAAGSILGVAIGAGWIFMDITQFRERNKAPKEQSWYNPARLWDRVWGAKGSTRMAVAAGA